MNLINVHLAQSLAKEREQEIARHIEHLQLVRPDTATSRRSSLVERLRVLRHLPIGRHVTGTTYKAA